MRFQLKQYGAEAVAFDTASGDTHYLPPFSFALFQLCGSQPRLTHAEIGRHLAAQHGLADDDRLQAQIDDALAGLHRIGLLQAP